MAERLADKYEEAKEKQEDIMNRWVQTMLSFITDHLLLNCKCGRTEWAESATLVGLKTGLLKFSLLGLSGDFSVLLQVQTESACCLEMPCETSWKRKVKSWAPET